MSMPTKLAVVALAAASVGFLAGVMPSAHSQQPGATPPYVAVGTAGAGGGPGAVAITAAWFIDTQKNRIIYCAQQTTQSGPPDCSSKALP